MLRRGSHPSEALIQSLGQQSTLDRETVVLSTDEWIGARRRAAFQRRSNQHCRVAPTLSDHVLHLCASGDWSGNTT
jgi:hypothetical protein